MSAPSRLLPRALFSLVKWPLSQTSAKPSVRPDPVLVWVMECLEGVARRDARMGHARQAAQVDDAGLLLAHME